MLRFLRKSHPKDSEERERLKRELFGFTRCVDHGFPSKPSCLGYDPKLSLLAIGTKTGVLKIYGAPGVEFAGQHKNDVSLNQLFFLPEQGRIITLCSDNSLHLWEINIRDDFGILEEVKEFSMESNKLKTISACCLTPNAENMLLGTEGGNIHLLDVKTFHLMEPIIYQDVVMQNVPDDFKVTPGAVEAIAVHPTNADKFLIGYNRGLIVLWDIKESNADQTYNAMQQLESLSWQRSGEEFMSAHADGSYVVWSSTDSESPKKQPTTPFGPFPCKAISKIQWKTTKTEPFIIFSGGMPRASYGDKHTISVMQENTRDTAFDFTSRVIDFFTISRADEIDSSEERAEYDDAHTLVVLAEEELVVIDLESPNWPSFRLPYLNSLHSSAITCSHHVNNVPEQMWQKIVDAGESQVGNFSQRTWPINGGKSKATELVTRDLLLTGHEDGTVRFWDASTTSLTFLYKLTTASIFNGEVSQTDSAGDGEEEWPPFRKVGSFDPYSDDPRWAIQKIVLCPLSETLVVAGTAGQVIVLQMEREQREQEVKHVPVSIVSDNDNFVWRGHEALVPKEGDLKFAPGFQATCVMQLSPPAACTALTLNSEWQLVAAGTAHGFALFDYLNNCGVVSRCTLNPNDLSGGATSDSSMSRRKSFKKSLRESFRRLRQRRSDLKKAKEKQDKEKKGDETAIESESKEGAVAATSAGSPSSQSSSPEPKPVERQVEARSVDDSMSSMVRYLYFADTYVVSGLSSNPSLWVGTNAGHVYVYTITVPPNDKRTSEAVSSSLAKEIKLRHRAPVISMAVVDKRARVLPEPLEVQHERAKSPDMSGDHQLIICSEEQFKVFSLPQLRPVCKYKLTALDGSRVRKLSFVNFRSRSDENYSEFDIACLTNQGDLRIFTLPNLRWQLTAHSIRKEDINGISSFNFTKNGQGFFLVSSSEFVRVSLSKRYVTQPVCEVELKAEMRPTPEMEPEPQPTTDAEEPAQDMVASVTAAAAAVIEVAEDELGQQYGSSEITEALSDDTQQNDSRADTTTGDISQDSVRDVVSEVGTISPQNSPTTAEPEVTTIEVPTTPASNLDDDAKATRKTEINNFITETEEKVRDLAIEKLKTVESSAAAVMDNTIQIVKS